MSALSSAVLSSSRLEAAACCPVDLRPRPFHPRMLLRGQPANMSAAKIDWLPAEGGHGHLPEVGRGEGGVGSGLGCLS